MGLSFEESLKKNMMAATIESKNEIEVATVSENNLVIENASIMTLDESYGIAAYSGDDGSWQQHSGYVTYSIFSDDNISTVGEEKDIYFPFLYPYDTSVSNFG